MPERNPLNDEDDEYLVMQWLESVAGREDADEEDADGEDADEEDADEEDASGETERALPSDLRSNAIELEKIPRRLWKQTLAPLPRQRRYFLAYEVSDPRLRDLATHVALELDLAEVNERKARTVLRARARRTGVPLPTPGADHAVVRPTTQVNMRLRRDDHARLAQAAAAAGCKPTTLARALVLNGVAMILREHAAPPHG